MGKAGQMHDDFKNMTCHSVFLNHKLKKQSGQKVQANMFCPKIQLAANPAIWLQVLSHLSEYTKIYCFKLTNMIKYLSQLLYLAIL